MKIRYRSISCVSTSPFILSSSSFKYNFFKDKRGIRKRNLDDVVFKAQGEMHVWETICSVERTVAEGILFK